jgi:hypothetical protein
MSRRRARSPSSQQLSLLAALRAAGWQVVARATEDLPWWADEVWMIESIWRPLGLQAFVTFHVCPFPFSWSRREGEGLDGVGCTRTWPEVAGHDDRIADVPVNHWDRSLVELMGRITEFRDQAV